LEDRGQPGPRGVRIGAGDPDHPGAVHAPGGVRLAAEAGAEVVIEHVLGPDHLHGGERPRLGPAEIDDAHAALAEPDEQPGPADEGGIAGAQRGVDHLRAPSSLRTLVSMAATARACAASSSPCAYPLPPSTATAIVTGPSRTWSQKYDVASLPRPGFRYF